MHLRGLGVKTNAKTAFSLAPYYGTHKGTFSSLFNLHRDLAPKYWTALILWCILQGGNSAPENELRPWNRWYTRRSFALGACPWSKTLRLYRPWVLLGSCPDQSWIASLCAFVCFSQTKLLTADQYVVRTEELCSRRVPLVQGSPTGVTVSSVCHPQVVFPS